MSREVKELGPLHALLTRGLPDWCDENGRLQTYALAKHLGVSHQALYKAYGVNRLSTKRIKQLITLSENSIKATSAFKPLTFSDFADLI